MKKYSDKKIESLWKELEDVLFIEAKDFYDDVDDNDIQLVLASDWFIFDAGTSQETIWGWFNRNYSKGLQELGNKNYEYRNKTGNYRNRYVSRRE